MSNLLQKYELIKEARVIEAEEAAKVAEVEEVAEVIEDQEDVEKVASAEEMEVIEKYATAADDLLADEYGEDYTEEDVEKLATLMIEHDANDAIEEQQTIEKVAALEEAGQVIALSFLETLKNAD